MNEYIFYTTEGYTYAPNENYEVENCQVLGMAQGETSFIALNNLLKENKWIEEAGFAPDEFLVKQVLTKEQRRDIQLLVDYLYVDEKKHFEESEDNSNHIFNVIERVKHI